MKFSEISKKDNKKIFKISCFVKDYEVFDSCIHAEIEGSACTLSGIWYEPGTTSVISNSKTRKTVYITSVLIDIAENHDFLKSSSKEITNIDFGYMSGSLYEDSGHVTATALPYYRLTDKDGNTYYYDAADGTYRTF